LKKDILEIRLNWSSGALILKKKYSQSQTELAQVSAALDDANALSSSLRTQLDSEKVTYGTVPCVVVFLLLA
jgi:hypothetical protein